MKLIQRISDQLPLLPKTQQVFAEYIVRHTFVVATLPIDEAAGHAGVSLATANRCVRSLGFEGYAQMRSALMQEFKPSAANTSSVADKSQKQAQDVSLQADIANLAATGQKLTAPLLAQAVKLITGAQRIYWIGMGSSESLTCYAQHACGPFTKAAMIDLGGVPPESSLRHLLRLSSHDLVVGISLPRYSKNTVGILEFSKRAGAKVLAITDHAISPLCQYADVSLFATADHTHMSASPVAAMALINSLATALMQSSPQSIQLAAKQADLVTPYIETNMVQPGH